MMNQESPPKDILFLTKVLPYPLNGGAKVRAYYMLRHLAQNYRVTLVSFIRDDDHPEFIEHLQQYCHAIHTVPIKRSILKDVSSLAESLLTRMPAVIVRDRQPAMLRRLAQLVGERDYAIVHADQTEMAQYAQYAADAASNRPAIVLDQHNALYLLVARQAALEPGWRKVLWRREAGLLRAYEAGLMQHFDHILTVTEEDAVALEALLPDEAHAEFRQRQTTLPICVDPEHKPAVEPKDEGLHILHLGTMFWPPNIEGVLWFGREVFPAVLRVMPDACFTIAGKAPPKEVKALAEPGSDIAGNVQVTGFVHDPTPLLERARVFIVPVRAGGGMRVKIVDGWQWGLPIVSTTIGAEGIVCQPGANIFLADEAEDFAEAVIRLLKDETLRQRIRENGRQWVLQHYNWRTVYPRLDSVYQSLSDKT